MQPEPSELRVRLEAIVGAAQVGVGPARPRPSRWTG